MTKKKAAVLIVFSGLPGVGKTGLSRRIAGELNAAYVRIDTIEQAIVEADVLKNSMGPTGYLVGYGVAEDNLKLGLTVVADSVNPLLITRRAWRDVAARAGVPVVEVEVVCSDQGQHRSRVETRVADIRNHKQPTWEDVMKREYDTWDTKPIVVDTASRSLDKSVDELRRLLNLAISA